MGVHVAVPCADVGGPIVVPVTTPFVLPPVFAAPSKIAKVWSGEPVHAPCGAVKVYVVPTTAVKAGECAPPTVKSDPKPAGKGSLPPRVATPRVQVEGAAGATTVILLPILSCKKQHEKAKQIGKLHFQHSYFHPAQMLSSVLYELHVAVGSTAVVVNAT
jgi:hypothetical protein